MWQEIEKFIEGKNFNLNENDYNLIFIKVTPRIRRWSINAHQRALGKGVFIDIDDFFSYFQETVWNCIKSYVALKGNGYQLSHIISHRIKLAEAMVWRSYRNTGTNNDKDQTQYKAGQLLPLNLEVKSPYSEFSYFDLFNQLNEFERSQPIDGKVVKLLLAGYRPKEISQILFSSTNYSSKYRKRINRIRKKFERYIHS